MNFKSIPKLSAAGTNLVYLHHRHKYERSECSEKRTRTAQACYFLYDTIHVHGKQLRVSLYYLNKPPIATEFGVRYLENTSSSQNEIKFNDKYSSLQDRQCTYKRNIEARSHYPFCGRKAIIVTYYECLCSFLSFLQCKAHALVTLSSVVCQTLYHIFPHYHIKGTIFGGKSLLNLLTFWRRIFFFKF